MSDVIAWIAEHWELIALVLGALITAAVAIAKRTRTKRDDEIVGVLSKVWQAIQRAADKLPPKTGGR